MLLLQLAEDTWDSIRDQILVFAAASNRSGKPAIYGLAATAELQRIKPLTDGESLKVTCTAPGL